MSMSHEKYLNFVTEYYIDSNFSSGGVKLNYFILKELSQLGYKINLYAKKAVITNSVVFNKICKFNEYDASARTITISDKGCVISDITYIHDHSYIFRQKMMSNRLSHVFYKIFNRKKHLRRLAEYITVKENLSKTKIIVVSSKILKEDLIENYNIDKNRIVIIPPPIEQYTLQKRCKNEIFTFGVSVVGFVRKGGYLVLKAIKELKNKGYKFKVKLIYPSENSYVRFLIELYGIKKYCEFLPLQKSMGDFYCSLDCLLMPSVIEPFGMVASEALSVGCPVVTGEHCGASDIIKNGENGFLYKGNKDYKNLARTMEQAITVIKQKDLSQNCINSVSNLGTKSFIDSYIGLISQII